MITEDIKTEDAKIITKNESNRKNFLDMIRENRSEPDLATISITEALNTYGTIDVDEDAVNELRRQSIS